MTCTNTPKQKQTPQFTKPTGPTTTHAVITELWERAQGSMSQDDLQWFSFAGDQASCVMLNLRQVINGIAGLIDADNAQVSAGNFQHKSDIVPLLYFIEQSLSTIDAMSEIGREADYFLRAGAKGGA
ncbi:hypothetical protein FHW67_000358 [Herbaspirillum sp. Sphag1AN]|uniref:hypothetical protein n=1 Tax=unclassified Herbaspirillum TaxID=2624150 RepID=UPI0016225556|nr:MULTISPECIES: hypothetical protein [unclassified Herbaspirillum]MBB3211123.1 hypothetical protein [Herbaspirillum sp. Sphag1AN]MBB3244752.1 hypothetical protein [Herbaspirillum sp. Sphag64]